MVTFFDTCTVFTAFQTSNLVYRPLEVTDALSDTHEVLISFIIILRCYLPFSCIIQTYMDMGLISKLYIIIIYDHPIWIIGAKLDKGKVSLSYLEILTNGEKRS